MEKPWAKLSRFLTDGLITIAFVLSSGWIQLMRNDSSLDMNQLLLIGLYALFIPSLIFQWKRVPQVAARDPFIWLLVGVAAVSPIWSDVPTSTLARSLGIVASTLFGLSLAVRYEMKELVRLVTWAVGIVLVLSLIIAVLLPEYGVMSGLHIGSWRGIYSHKNHLGRMALLGSLTFLFQALSRQHRRLAWLGFGLAVFLLFMTRSATSLVVFVLLTGLVPLYKAFRFNRFLGLAFVCLLASGVIAGVWVLIENMDLLFGVLGRDFTLTGRTLVWGAVIDAIVERPWLGYGYGGFWTGGEGWSSIVWQASGWNPGDAHNGLLDLLLDLGLAGAALFVFGFLRNYGRAASYARLAEISEAYWPMTFLTCLVLYNLTESAILRPTNLFWILYVSTVLALRAPKPVVENAGSPRSLSHLQPTHPRLDSRLPPVYDP